LLRRAVAGRVAAARGNRVNSFDELDVQNTEPGISDGFWRDREDEKKVLEFRAGSREALADLFRRYRKDVYEIAYRFTNNVDDALEITQEVFMKLIESLETFRRGSRFFTWLYRIAVNHAIDYLRRRKRRGMAPLDEDAHEALNKAGDPVERAEGAEFTERLRRALDQLSQKHRTVIVLHGLENLSYREIAQIVGCSTGTVMSRLFYARKRLAELLGEP
jgi:RNA polymerase sigma-70 factor, ECF subfamily